MVNKTLERDFRKDKHFLFHKMCFIKTSTVEFFCDSKRFNAIAVFFFKINFVFNFAIFI